MLVVLALVFFRLVQPLGMVRVELGHTLAAVLGITETAVGIDLVEEVHPQLVQEHTGHIPAQIQVPAHQVRDLVGHGVEGTADGVAGQGGQAAGVQLVDQIVEDLMVVHHVGLVLGGNGDLVGDAPDTNGGVVVVLDHQLGHLRDGVLPAIGHMLRNIGNFRPDHQTSFVAQIIEILIVLIVGQSQGVGSHLLDDGHVGVVMLLMQGVADALPVLMAAHTPEGIAAAIEEEALLGVHMEGADTESGGNFVHLAAVHHEDRLAGVQIGVHDAVPQVDVFDGQHGIGTGAMGDHIAPVIQNPDEDLALGGIVPGPDPDVGILAADLGGNGNAGTAVVVQVEVVLVDGQQDHVPVDAAVEGEIGLLGVHPVVLGVVHLHHQMVLGLQMVGDVTAEGGVAAVMNHNDRAVQNDLGRGVDTVELQINPLVSGKRRLCEVLLINTGPPPVVTAAVLPVQSIPGVGQIQNRLRTVMIQKQPVVIDNRRVAHVSSFNSGRPTVLWTALILERDT